MARDQAVDFQLEKVEAMQAIMSYGIMSTPGVVIDGWVVLPDHDLRVIRDQVESRARTFVVENRWARVR